MSDTNKIRVISGAVLTVIVAVAGIVGGPLLLAGCLALSITGLNEYTKCLSITDESMKKTGYAVSVIYYLVLLYAGRKALYIGAAGAFLAYMILHIKRYPELRFEDTIKGFLSFLWIPYLMSFIYLARASEGGFTLYALLFICSWLGDSFAYSIGRRFGKHKMTPVLSPNKSWEGFIAEVAGVTIVGLIYGLCVRKSLNAYSLPVLACVISAFAGSLLSVAGDLTASAVKREFGIKDYGTLIPGHGGVLDRFDSILFAAPFVYFIFTVMAV